MAEILWREWGQEAFDEAAKARKPVLLDISAVWCHWCHVMHETTYRDPDVVRAVNRDFVPVRVDTDRRPDVNRRYNMGGWPTTVFLTPGGEILTGTTYVPPDDMKRLLGKVSEFYREHEWELAQDPVGGAGTGGVGAGGETTARNTPVPAAGTVLDRDRALEAVEEVRRKVEEAYDPLHGGFGVAPKFPQVKALELLLTLHLRTGEERPLAMVEKTLRAMRAGGLYDKVAGGFFRYSTTRGWDVPHFGKMLEDNAQLLSLYARMAQLTGDDFYVETVRGLVRYLTTWLRSENGFFYGSQDADESYYRLDEAERREREAPKVDRTLYVGWNALAARGFLEAYLATAEVRLREAALVALECVWGAARLEDGLVAHYVDGDGPHGPVLLADATELCLAFLDAYETTGEEGFLDRAVGLLEAVVRSFGDPASGGFFDTLAGGEKPGRLRFRQKGLDENSRTAVALLRAAEMTGEERWRAEAERALVVFLGPHRRYGILAADYALALDRAVGPTAVLTVSGEPEDPAVRALAREAAA
ncbi:MAG TPA: thioredoxin domain-containing protein, partial [Clostridiales bacterium]|nr:thioredoxin domain-containing protein [Clostridiales bacterium]